MSLGFAVAEAPFTYGSWVGRWATPALGTAWMFLIAAVAHLGAHRQFTLAIAALLGGAGGTAVAGQWLARTGVSRGRVPGVNLEATRGVPAVWLCAH